MSLSVEERITIARAAYSSAVRIARESPTPAAWARLLRAATNLRVALAAQDGGQTGQVPPYRAPS